uniref:Uncharacterized protein n=1 Tax=Rhizophora mucronata TaxID=61149 RepID=A0A2P2NWS2_RHIMU
MFLFYFLYFACSFCFAPKKKTLKSSRIYSQF